MTARAGVDAAGADGAMTQGRYDPQRVDAALESADLNVLRVALYQQTRDPEIARIPVEPKTIPGTPYQVLQVPDEHRETLLRKGREYLLDPEAPRRMALTRDEVGELAAMFQGEPVSESEVVFAYEEMAFDGFKRWAEWSDGKGEVPDGFWVLIVGAGFSGIVAAIQLQHLGIPYRIVERQGDFGGTWLLNHYPDARVDITNFIYSYTLEPDYPWRHTFAPREELMAYVRYIVDKYGLAPHASFDTKVTAAAWSEGSARWEVTIEGAGGRAETLAPNVVISCAGLFSTPKMPAIEGIDTFRGRMFHTTAWEHDYDYAGKRVALIGTGSTGSQLLPSVAEEARSVAVYQRTPNWVTPIGRYRSPIPPARRWLLEHLPGYANWNRFSHVLASVRVQSFQYLDPDWQANGGLINEENDRLRKMLVGVIRHKMAGKSELVDDLIPEFAPLSRRIVVDNGWYEALMRDNVDLVTDDILRITPTGIVTRRGDEREFDLIVLAAGFEVERYLHPVEYVGRDGATTAELWSHDGARAYLTMLLPGFPNFFIMYGPNAGVRAGSFHSAVELLTRYICGVITAMVERGATSAELRRQVYVDYNRRLDEGMKALLWEDQKGGNSYYLNRHGKSGVNMPWEMHEFYDFLHEVDPDEYVFR